MKKYPILLIILLLVPLCMAFSQYQFDDATTGLTNNAGTWNITAGTFSSRANGADFQPLANDLDNDGVVELFTTSGTSIISYTVDNNKALNIEDEVLVGGSQITMMHIERSKLFLQQGTNLTIYNYTNNTFNLMQTNFTNLTTGFSCGNFSGVIGCYAATAQNKTLEINADTLGFSELTLSLAPKFDTKYSNTTSPAQGTIYNDGQTVFIFACDLDGNGDEGVCVFNQNSADLETRFSSDGVLDDLGSVLNDAKISGITTANSGGGLGEIFITWQDETSGFGFHDTFLTILKSDGSLLVPTIKTFDNGLVDNAYSTAPIIIDFDDDNVLDICYIITLEAAANSRTLIQCKDIDTTGTTFTFDTSDGTDNDNLYAHRNQPIIGGDINNDGITDIITGSGSLIYTSSTTFDFINYTCALGTCNSAIPIFVDMNEDNNADVCGQKGSLTYCAFSDVENTVPVVDNTLNFGGYGHDFGFVVCVNSSITFTAQECDGITSCNFNNDFSIDTERIVSNCGLVADFTTNIENGTLHQTTPSFSCFYNSTGTFQVRLFLQDNANLNDFSEFNTQTIPISVITGVSGSSCNIISGIGPGQSGTSTTGVGNEIDNFVEQVTQGSAVVRQIGGIFGVVINVVLAALVTTNVVVLLIVLFLSVAVFTFVWPLLSIWWFVILIVAGIVIWFLSKLTGGDMGSGGSGGLPPN